LKSKLKEIFKENEINGKYKGEKNYNQSVIDKIYEENITELIDILETTYLDAFNTFRDMKSSENFNGLENINKVIEEIQNKEKDDEYINKIFNSGFYASDTKKEKKSNKSSNNSLLEEESNKDDNNFDTSESIINVQRGIKRKRKNSSRNIIKSNRIVESEDEKAINTNNDTDTDDDNLSD